MNSIWTAVKQVHLDIVHFLYLGTGFGFGTIGASAGQAQTNIFGTPQQNPVFGSGSTPGFGTSGLLWQYKQVIAKSKYIGFFSHALLV